MEKFLIIDGNSIVNRAFYALPLLSNSQGQYSNAVYGFTNILTKAILEQKPDYIAIAFDFGKKTFRNQIFPEYKATRKGMPSELASQMPILKELLSVMGIEYFEKENIEADDIIGTLACQKGVQKLLLSGDRDLFQLIDDETLCWFPKKGISEVDMVDRKKLKELMGLTPEQVVEYKAIRGDASDNIPGVNGIGEKGALNLIQEYNSIEEIYKNIDKISGKVKEKLISGKEMAETSKKLATIKRDVDIKFDLKRCKYPFPFDKKVFDFFKKYDFKSLTRRNEIFDQNTLLLAKEETQSFKKIIITSEEKLEEVIGFIREEKRVAFDFSKELQIACSPNAIYSFEQEISMFSNSISIERALSILRNIFEDKNIEKLCFDLKKHKHIFDKANIQIVGDIFDIALAKYLVGDNVKENNLEIAEYFFAKKELTNKMAQSGVDSLYQKIELPLEQVLYEMEKDGLLVDISQLEELQKSLKTQLEELTQKIWKYAGEEFNLNSPKQLSNILFNKLDLKAPKNSKNSTNVDVLTEIESQHEIIQEILKYRKVQKLLSTYVEEFTEIAKKNNGYIRTIFNQTLTSTGRLSSSEPNLQNLPIRSEEGKQLRKIFISRFKNGELISADYNQIELRLMAHYSQDSTLLKAYENGEDIHSRTASSVFGVPLRAVTPQMRRLAKTVNFGIIYGISDYGLSLNLGTSVSKAKSYIDTYFKSFPRVKEYINESIELAKARGFASTLFGRIRLIPEIKDPNGITRKFGERVAINMPLQGSASDIIKIAMINVNKEIEKHHLESKLVLQIHDELIIDSPHNEIDIVSKILKTEMENVTKLSVPLPVEISHGKTLYECK